MKPFDKYDRLGDYHWKCWRETPEAAYCHHARHCQGWVKERRVLDVGCGDGLITSLFGDAQGMDVSPLAVKLAVKHGVNAIRGDLYKPPYILAEIKYPAIFLGDVIEHLERPEEGLRQAGTLLEPGGYLYVVTPPKQPTLSEYHYREYSPEELVYLCEGCGFKLVGEVLVMPEWVEMYAKFRLEEKIVVDQDKAKI